MKLFGSLKTLIYNSCKNYFNILKLTQIIQFYFLSLKTKKADNKRTLLSALDHNSNIIKIY